MGKDEGERCKIYSLVCFELGHVSYSGLTTSKEVWDKLEIQYMSKMSMNKLLANLLLYNLKMHEGSELQQYGNMFNNIIINLVKFGVNIDDEYKVIILLGSLLGSYDHLVTTLTYGKYVISLDVITTTILSHCQRRQNVNE